jgi:hypothetical protein
MIMCAWVLVLSVITVHSAAERISSAFEYWKPTKEELQRAYVLKPPSYWGHTLIEEAQSVTVLLIRDSVSPAFQNNAFIPAIKYSLRDVLPSNRSYAFDEFTGKFNPTTARRILDKYDFRK